MCGSSGEGKVIIARAVAVRPVKMEDRLATDELSIFLESGVYRFENSNFIFIDPVRVLNRSYSRFRVSPAAYYRRFFDLAPKDLENKDCLSSAKKRKRKEKKIRCLNDKERAADQRHQVPMFVICNLISADYFNLISHSQSFLVPGLKLHCFKFMLVLFLIVLISMNLLSTISLFLVFNDQFCWCSHAAGGEAFVTKGTRVIIASY